MSHLGPSIQYTGSQISHTLYQPIGMTTNETLHDRRYDCYVKVHQMYVHLSYDVASGSEITSCNKIDKPLVLYIIIFGKRFDVHNNVAYIMTKL